MNSFLFIRMKSKIFIRVKIDSSDENQFNRIFMTTLESSKNHFLDYTCACSVASTVSCGRYRLVVLESISFDSALMLAQEPAVVSCTNRAFREETKSQIFHGAVEYSFQSGLFRLVFHCSNGVLMVPEATRPSITALGLYMLRAVYSQCLRALPCEPQQCFFSSPIHLR